MTEPRSYYQARIADSEQQVGALTRSLRFSSLLRAGVFLLSIGLVYCLSWHTGLAMGTGLAGLIGFLFLVARHTDLKRELAKAKAILAMNARELRHLDMEFKEEDSGADLRPERHAFAHDLDLFGQGSFFQYLSRSESPAGRERLAERICENSIEAIPEKQSAFAELASRIAWMQDFRAEMSLIGSDVRPRGILKKLKQHRAFSWSYAKPMAYVFSLLSLVIITAYALDYIAGNVVLLWFFLGLGLTGRLYNKVTPLARLASEAQALFGAYSKLLSLIEQGSFETAFLKSHAEQLALSQGSASSAIAAFSKLLGALDQRNNILFGFLANGFLLWDIRCSAGIEDWLSEHGEDVERWFEVVAEFESIISFGTFVFNHPNYKMPMLRSEGNPLMQAKGLIHPLLKEEVAVGNPIDISEGEFFIITGANMAGKSTYLRAIGLSIVMANLGLPVRAQSMSYRPIRLISSMRSEDSLAEDTSYFFAELKRLRYLSDQLLAAPHFVILDEILKGTNSEDKALGSRKFVEKLVASGSTGIIATHDLSLCALGDELTQVHNYYLDAEIIDDELFFDYTLKSGVCQNMNASFLLQKMGLV